MVVIYAEKSSLATDLAHFLKAGKRIALKDEPTIGYYEFTYKGEPAILCHGVGQLLTHALHHGGVLGVGRFLGRLHELLILLCGQ